MSCEIARRMMAENDPGLADHRRSCPSCMVQAHARYYEAPAGLESKIRSQLRKEAEAPPPWRWMAIAASLLLMASLAWNVAMLRGRVDPRQALASDVVSAHIRSLAGTHLLDVPSSDHHTVKPWFNGKLDFSPAVKDVEGFRLLGGRLEYLEGHPAAALVYGRRNHVINLFTWPSAETDPVSEVRNGYQIDSWYRDGMMFWAVSDLNATELREFEAQYRKN
jgi:anti-sigma factor RsiW